MTTLTGYVRQLESNVTVRISVIKTWNPSQGEISQLLSQRQVFIEKISHKTNARL